MLKDRVTTTNNIELQPLLVTPLAMPVILRPSPFKLATSEYHARPGQSIADILGDIPDLPPEIWTHGVVQVGGIEVPREWWSRVKPKPGTRHLIYVGVKLAGGGGGGGKNIFTTIAAIALVVAVTAISGGILGPAGALSISGTLFAAGSTSAALLAAGVSVVGALALNALAPTAADTQTQEEDGGKKAELGAASIQGNVLEPFGAIPFVAGTHRVSPPHLILPWTESVNDDQFVYAIVGLNGAHDFNDIRVNNAPIGDFDADEIEFEVRDVVNDDTPVTLITQQVYENQAGIAVSAHKINDDATDELQNLTTPSLSYPRWHGVRSRTVPDEIWLQFGWSALVAQTDEGTARAGTPLRIRIRRAGEITWINLPEFHVQRERLEAFRGMIKLRFQAAGPALTRLDQDVTVPPWSHALYLTDTDNDELFEVDEYFDLESGNNADNVSSEDGVAVIFLDPEVFPLGTYDIQVKRGYGYIVSDFIPSAYTYLTEIPYFFSHIPASSPPAIRQEQAKLATQIGLQSISSVWDEPPLKETGLSLIAIKAKNIAINSLTTIATGYANTWDGNDWDTFEPTNNPAAWWRFLALGGQSARATFIEAQLDDDSLTDWFDFCEGSVDERVYECNAFFNTSRSIGEVLRIVGACGRAAVRMSDKIGVVIDRDRSAESPIQLFTQRNARGLTIRRAFPRIPDGLRVRFNNEDNDYEPEEIFVYRKALSTVPLNIEAISYLGITNTSQVIDRAYLDLGQLLQRGRLYSHEVDIENLYCVKGSLVALVYDTLARHYDAARVVSVQTSGGDVTGLTLDAPLRLSLIGSLGDPSDYPAGVVIQLKDGTTITEEIDEEVDTDTITFATPFTIPVDDNLEEHCLVACGPLSGVEKRMLVLGIDPLSDYTAALTLVDESIRVPIIDPDGEQLVDPDSEGIFAPF
jgi:hypothetical protein